MSLLRAGPWAHSARDPRERGTQQDRATAAPRGRITRFLSLAMNRETKNSRDGFALFREPAHFVRRHLGEKPHTAGPRS